MPRYRYGRNLSISICLWLALLATATSDPVFQKVQEQKSTLETTGYLTTHELQLFRESLQFIKDESCRRALNATLQGLLSNAQWAVSMLDASVRTPVGIESQVIHQLGHFDQCFQKPLPQPVTSSETIDFLQPVPVQYCLVDVTISGVTSMETNVIE
uniref:Nose resistant-to-fluoxetine protein N-terminal domain-containing protein n=1 Tax=Stomoxys calcitrans TaxID=35570 RepID=A0A1I8P3C0_STOCA